MARYFNRYAAPKRPTLVYCGNHSCPRTNAMRLENYTSSGPAPGTPPENIHRVAQPDCAGWTILCAMCNHYTLFLRASEV